VALNPPAEVEGKKLPKAGANIGLISLRHIDFANDAALSYGEKSPFIIASPGEYEVGGLFIRGISTGVGYIGSKELINTAYTLLIDGIMVCHLGGLLPETLSPKAREEIGAVDVVFVPIEEADKARGAHHLAASLLPSIIIPLDLTGGPGLVAFLKEAGEKTEPVDKLTLKKKDLEGSDDTKVVVLSPF
jgi:L-ascorbate metabolism protein UlaG (beta-lactamase superfamily)